MPDGFEEDNGNYKRYFLNNIEAYSELTILSFTPSFFLPFPEDDAEKEEYSRRLKSRLTEENVSKSVTKIFLAESGLKKMKTLDENEKKNHIEYWKELSKRSDKYPDNLSINVLKDDFLPPFSFFIGKTGGNWEPRAPYDVFVKYPVSISREHLFNLSEKDKSEWIYHVPSKKLPKHIQLVMERLEELKNCEKFSKWFGENESDIMIPNPRIAIYSAMRREIQFYGKVFTLKGNGPNRRGYLSKGERRIDFAFPSLTYGKYPIYFSATQLIEENTEGNTAIDKFYLVGVAGGLKDRVKLLDVVISKELVSVIYEKLVQRESVSSRSGRKEIDLCDKFKWVIGTKQYGIHQELLDLADNLHEQLSFHNETWKQKIGEMIEILKEIDESKGSKLVDKYNEITQGRLPDIVIEPMWSSDHNINSDCLSKELSDKYGVKAFEMEGGGLAEALSHSTRVQNRFLEIRGISDYAEGGRDHIEDEILQTLATMTATAALKWLLEIELEST